MPDDQTRKVKSTFLEARERSGSDREAFLHDACAGDSRLRTQVDHYLSAEDQAGEFLAKPDKNRLAADLFVSPQGGGPLSELPGTIIDRYELLEVIGEGGFGMVFRAEQKTPIHRRVALKIIKLGMDTRQVITRFRAECQVLAMLDHPNIAKVLDAGETATGRPYFVMELVEGIPITEYCDQHLLSIEQRLTLFIATCQALQHAHQNGIIHRDIKPGNILVTIQDAAPVPKLIDFGIAKAMQARGTERTLVTEHRQLIGTPAYMSPEQAEMNGREIDTRSDIYSLGVLLYELLTGTTPIDAKELRSAGYGEVHRMIREADPPRPSTRVSGLGKSGGQGGTMSAAKIAANRGTDFRRLKLRVQGELDWIVMKAMEKDRARRYESAGEFARDILRHLQNQPVEACPPSPVYIIGKFLKRHRSGSLIAAAAVVIAFAALLAYLQSIRTEQRKTHTALTQAQNATIRALSAEADANERLVASVVSRARAQRISVIPGRRFDALSALAAVGRKNSSLDVCSQAAGCLALADIRVRTQWQGPGDGICFGHDCTVYADNDSVTGDILVCRVPAASGDSDGVLPPPIGRLHGRFRDVPVAFSRDDQLIAVAEPDGSGWHVKTYTLTGQLKFDIPSGPAFDFTPDGKGLAVANPGGPVVIYDLQTGKQNNLVNCDAGASVAFSPDGKQLATWNGFGLPERLVDICDLTTGQVIHLPKLWGVLKVVWHPSGTRIAVGDLDNKIYQWDVSQPDGPVALASLTGHNAAVGDLAFNHAGNLLASSSASEHCIRLWDVSSGAMVLRTGGSGRLQFSNDDNLLATTINAHNRHEVMQIASGRERRTFIPPPGYNGRSIALSRDGSLMACGGDNVVRIWNLTDPSYSVPLDVPFEDDVAREMAFRPDGKGLIVRTEKGIWTIPFQKKSTPTVDAGSTTIRISPKITRIFPLPFTHGGDLKLSADGQWAAVAHYGQLPVLVNLLDPTHSLVLKSAPRETMFIAISPDQKWVATGKWKGLSGPSVSVWDAKTGEKVADVPVTFTANVAFAPDGKWLTTSTSLEYRFVRVGSWKTEFSRPINLDLVSNISFTTDSRIQAISPGTWGVQLTEAATGNPIVTLDDVGEEQPIKFSPDDGELATWCIDGTIRLWDLRRIRQELSEIGLDWPGPPLPPQAAKPLIHLSLATPDR